MQTHSVRMEIIMKKNNAGSIILYLLALLGIIVGGMAVRLTDLGPFNLGFYRLFTATIILLPFGWKYRKEYGKKELAISILSGVFFAFSVATWNVAVTSTSISSAGLILNMWVFISVLLCALVFKEKVSKYAYLGMVIAMAGLVVMVMGQKNSEASSAFGNFMAFGSAATYALYILATYKVKPKLNPFGLLFYSSLGGAVVLFICSAFTEGIQVPNETNDFLSILIIALVAQIGSLGLINIVLDKLSVVTVSLLSLLQPVMSSCLGFIVFHEVLSFVEILGIVIVISGIFFSDFDKYFKRKAKKIS